MPGNFPYFPWYPKDWRSEAKVRQLSYEERGVYFELLNLLWTYDGTCTLPDDDTFLRKTLELSPRKWVSIRKSLFGGIAPVLRSEAGRISNPRLTLEWERVTEKSCKAAASARSGVEKRAMEKERSPVNQHSGQAFAEPTQGEGITEAEPTHGEGNATQDLRSQIPDPDPDLKNHHLWDIAHASARLEISPEGQGQPLDWQRWYHQRFGTAPGFRWQSDIEDLVARGLSQELVINTIEAKVGAANHPISAAVTDLGAYFAAGVRTLADLPTYRDNLARAEAERAAQRTKGQGQARDSPPESVLGLDGLRQMREAALARERAGGAGNDGISGG